MVEQIWDVYDADNSGDLDKEETWKFVKECLGNLGSCGNLSQKAFDKIFITFDTDKSGTIEKSEMVDFIIEVLGGNLKKTPNSTASVSLTSSFANAPNDLKDNKQPGMS